MRGRLTAVRLATAVGLVAAAMTVPAQAIHVPGPVTVTISGYQFEPDEITVKLGQGIIWRNREPASAVLPPNKDHNLITELYQAPGEDLPALTDSTRICAKFSPGANCFLDPHDKSINIPALLPRGKHTLTCTIDRDHAILMHHTVIVT